MDIVAIIKKWGEDTGNIICTKSNIGFADNYRGINPGVHYVKQMLLATLETDREITETC